MGSLKRLGCAKDDAIYVGDSEVDKETADNAGLDAAWSPGASATGTSWNPSSRHTSSTRGKNWENSSEYEVPWLVARRGRPKGRPALGLGASG